MAYENFQDLSSRTDSDKVLQNETFNFAKNLEYDRYQCGFDSTL